MHRGTARPSLHHQVWEALGDEDPDWAVLTQPGRRHGGWTDELDAFYESGRAEVADVLASLPDPYGTQRAMDWGSGTGRLTFALLDTFEQVTAVDVSRSMLSTLVDRAAAVRTRGPRPSGARPGPSTGGRPRPRPQPARPAACRRPSRGAPRSVVDDRFAPHGWLPCRRDPRPPSDGSGSTAAPISGVPRGPKAQVHAGDASSPRALRDLHALPAPGSGDDTLESVGAEILAIRTWRDGAHEYARYLARRTR